MIYNKTELLRRIKEKENDELDILNVTLFKYSKNGLVEIKTTSCEKMKKDNRK